LLLLLLLLLLPCFSVAAAQGAAYELSHAVQVVGYDNSKQAWLVKNSWGDGWANEGYGWVSFSAPGMCDPESTYGLAFTPNQPLAVAKPRLTIVYGRPSCYSYTAVPGDYPEALATRFGLKLQQLLLDNLAVLKDPSRVPPGATLVLCGVSPAASAGAVVASGGPGRAPVVLVPAPRPTVQPPSQAPRGRPAVVMPRSGPVTVMTSSSPADEVAALLAIKRVLDPPGTALKDWQPGSSTACGWTGVTCDASSKRVTHIDFWDAGQNTKLKLSGQLPSGALLRRLPGLVKIGFAWMGLSGTLPEDWSQLTQLEYMSAHGNKLRGEFSMETRTLPHMLVVGSLVRDGLAGAVAPRHTQGAHRGKHSACRQSSWCVDCWWHLAGPVRLLTLQQHAFGMLT
jgi:hypothetical protein